MIGISPMVGCLMAPTGILDRLGVKGPLTCIGAGAANAGTKREAEMARNMVKKRIVQIVKETLKKRNKG